MKIRILKIEIVVICILLVALFFMFRSNPIKPSKDVVEGLAFLEQEEKKNVASAQEKVTKAQSALATPIPREGSYPERYAHAVIIGDSIAEACHEYGLLPKSIDLAVRGRRTDNSYDEVNTAIMLAPEHIFLCLGMNDLVFVAGNEKVFIKQYEDLIHAIQQGIPNAKIYVNSILPMTDVGYQETPYNKYDRKFNVEIKKMCEKMGITYIDNDVIIDRDPAKFEQDGIHPTYPFYSVWLEYMAGYAGI